MSETTDLRAEIARALRGHRWAPAGESEVGTGLFACACGFAPESSLAMEDHRADMVVEVVASRVRALPDSVTVPGCVDRERLCRAVGSAR